MRHIQTVAGANIRKGAHTDCGECQTSCQSACKTSCTVANQSCQSRETKIFRPEKNRD